MTPDSTITIPKYVLSESLNDETVVLDMSSGMYFGLSPVASRFWKLLSEGLTREKIQSILLNEFDVEPTVLAADLDALLAQLEAKKLIQQPSN
ncbi:PqqD family protein [Granulicella arctica]|uniref:PqqD family protein n=1 Tax=Granulicella arctica TaxID=940613 RepID=A0A7Y9PEW4_9BACT|nr:PqqD family protein [Granulicella arctica]NYF78405.1 hypothetical protein [Granulicella arctica]